MPATPHPIGPAQTNWFLATFTGGTCSGCKTIINEGDTIGYIDGIGLVRKDCCTVDGSTDDFELGTLTRTRRPELRVMPHGKTKHDTCPNCFIIHTAAQGDECW